MASKERPGPAFVALRAATLGIDDLSRQALRAWVSDAIDHRGERLPDRADPTEEATRTIVAGIFTLSRPERAAYRLWLVCWTDFTGRIITPHEGQLRREALRAAADSSGRSPN